MYILYKTDPRTLQHTATHCNTLNMWQAAHSYISKTKSHTATHQTCYMRHTEIYTQQTHTLQYVTDPDTTTHCNTPNMCHAAHLHIYKTDPNTSIHTDPHKRLLCNILSLCWGTRTGNGVMYASQENNIYENRPIKETYIHQKRPTKETHELTRRNCRCWGSRNECFDTFLGLHTRFSNLSTDNNVLLVRGSLW